VKNHLGNEALGDTLVTMHGPLPFDDTSRRELRRVATLEIPELTPIA